MKPCPHCNRALPSEAFGPNPRTRDGLTSWCRECRNLSNRQSRERHARRHEPTRVRAHYLRRTYGLTLGAYADLLDAQGARCAICASPASEPMHVDHDHVTGEVRGILCHNCNVGLGHFKDDQRLLGRALLYLAEHDLNVRQRSA